MTAFEKELETKLRELIEIELETNTLLESEKDPFKTEEQEIKKLEQLAVAFEENKNRIDKKISDLKGLPAETDPIIYEKDLMELIQTAVSAEVQKNYGVYPENVKKQEDSPFEEELLLKNAVLKRNAKQLFDTTKQKIKVNHQRAENIKDYQSLKSSTGNVESKKTTIEEVDKEEVKKRTKLLGNYWSKTHTNLLFTATVIQDVTKTFNKIDFNDLDHALSQLNNDHEIERKKINPDSEDYYFSFRVASGVKSRIFYQIMPEDFGNKRIVITRIIKQYHTRVVN